jgi:hypothetical protein
MKNEIWKVSAVSSLKSSRIERNGLVRIGFLVEQWRQGDCISDLGIGISDFIRRSLDSVRQEARGMGPVRGQPGGACRSPQFTLPSTKDPRLILNETRVLHVFGFFDELGFFGEIPEGFP